MEENLTSKEMPPEWMWPYPSRLNAHMRMIQRKRREKMGLEADDDDDVDEPVDEYEEDWVNEWVRANS